jgi:hypothetical protein
LSAAGQTAQTVLRENRRENHGLAKAGRGR